MGFDTPPDSFKISVFDIGDIMLVLEIRENSVESRVIDASREGKGSVLLFDRMIDMWPNCSVEVLQPGRKKSPPLGWVWYSAKSWPNVYKENWDTSD